MDLNTALSNANAQRFLRMLAQAEGTLQKGGGNPYRAGFGGSQIASLADHPRVTREFRQTDGKVNRTSAAGAYQFLASTWDGLAKQLGLKDFSPRSQDLGAMELIRQAGALGDVLEGRFDRAVAKTGRIWASLPSSPYAQPRKSAAFVASALGAPFPAPAPTQPKVTPMSNPYLALVPKPEQQPRAPQASPVRAQDNPYMALVPEAPKRGFFQELGRQAGLTVRHGIEGLASAADIVTEPIRYVQNKVAGAVGAPLANQSSSQAVAGVADWLGLPKPENATERVVADATRLMAGSAGVAGTAGRLAQVATSPVVSGSLKALAANPVQQIAAGAGAGAAGGAAREGGAGPVVQTLAALGGGLAGATAPGAVQRVAQGVKSAARAVAPRSVGQPQRLDVEISAALKSGGMDWDQIPEQVRQSIRADVQQALKTGDDLSPDALRRLVDFRTVGTTPTRGTLTLDPVQLTREKNLAKVGANSGNPDAQGLAALENQNNATLLEQLNKLGAGQALDEYQTGQRAVDALDGWLTGQKAAVNDLYTAARDTSGRAVQLDGATFTKQASQLLDDNLLGHALPKGVETHLNRIAMGEVPFDVNYAEQLKTVIGKLQRNTSDGQQRMALGLVRQALDDTPVMPAAGQVAQAGDDAIAAFNLARTANRNMMGKIERIPALRALHDGTLTPDGFIRQHIGSSAKVDEVSRLAAVLKQESPEAFEVVRNGMLHAIKQKAVNGAPDEVAKFSAAGYRRGLALFGPEKLKAFFSPEEIEGLKALGRVADYVQVQPAGSAVNNSNTGAMMVGKALDALGGLGGKLKLLGIGDQISVLVRMAQEKAATQVAPALVVPAARQVSTPAVPAGVAALLFGQKRETPDPAESPR